MDFIGTIADCTVYPPQVILPVGPIITQPTALPPPFIPHPSYIVYPPQHSTSYIGVPVPYPVNVQSPSVPPPNLARNLSAPTYILGPQVIDTYYPQGQGGHHSFRDSALGLQLAPPDLRRSASSARYGDKKDREESQKRGSYDNRERRHSHRRSYENDPQLEREYRPSSSQDIRRSERQDGERRTQRRSSQDESDDDRHAQRGPRRKRSHSLQ